MNDIILRYLQANKLYNDIIEYFYDIESLSIPHILFLEEEIFKMENEFNITRYQIMGILNNLIVNKYSIKEENGICSDLYVEAYEKSFNGLQRVRLK